MKAYSPRYKMWTPKNLEEALRALSEKPGHWKPFAGGTDIMVLFNEGHVKDESFMNINGLKDLKGISEDKKYLKVGALVSFSELQRHPTVKKEFPNLRKSASLTAALAIQNRGTLGGNIVNASPAADSPPAFLTYDAEVCLKSQSEERWVPLKDFFLGYKNFDLKPEELLTHIRIPLSPKVSHSYFRKVGTREAQSISKICLSGTALVEKGKVSNIRLAMGSVAPTSLRCEKTEKILKGKKIDSSVIAEAKDALESEISPIDDIRSTKKYRLKVSKNLLGDFLEQLKNV